MSSKRVRGLAARFRAALTDNETALKAAEQRRVAATKEAQIARAELLGELADFAVDVGRIDVQVDNTELRLRFSGHTVHFRPIGDFDRVNVVFSQVPPDPDKPKVEYWLYRQPELGHRWVLARRRRSKQDMVPLFDKGIEYLMIEGLKLPVPSEEPVVGQESPSEREL